MRSDRSQRSGEGGDRRWLGGRTERRQRLGRSPCHALALAVGTVSGGAVVICCRCVTALGITKRYAKSARRKTKYTKYSTKFSSFSLNVAENASISQAALHLVCSEHQKQLLPFSEGTADFQ